MSHTRQNMLSMPAKIIVVDKLPLLGSGKVDYVTLKGLGQEKAGEAGFQ